MAEFKLMGVKNTLKLIYVNNDAIGKYQDFSSLSLAYTGGYAYKGFTSSLGYTYKQKTDGDQ